MNKTIFILVNVMEIGLYYGYDEKIPHLNKTVAAKAWTGPGIQH